MKTINGRMRPLANLAMGLALVSIPVQAMAQEGHGGGERGNRGGGAGAPAAPRGGDMGGGQRSAPAQGQPMGGGFGGGGFGGGARNNAPAAPAAPAARPAPAAPSAPGGMNGGGWNGGQRGPDRGAIGSGWNNGRGDAQPQRNEGPRNDGVRNDGGRNDGFRGGNESWRGTPGWPQGGVNRAPGMNNGPGWNGNRGPGNSGMNAPRGDYRRWTQNWRQDNRYDWQRFRSSNRMAFHIGRYNPPYRGYAYRRLSVGLFLQPLFYSQSYVIYDPYNYRLPEVYGPYQWVRYYDDAMLVDTYTGEVVDVLYDFFW